MEQHDFHKRIDAWMTANQDRITGLVRDLVQIESETHPPHGNEQEVQEFLHQFCTGAGLPAEIYDIASVPGLEKHPLRNPDVCCEGRPNISIPIPGRSPASARSLILSGHIDTVPAGDPADWSDSPVSGTINGSKLFGRGAYDMKAGVAANIAVALMLQELGIELDGDLTVESVVDEEFAGGHGTIAARLHSGPADAVLIPEPSNRVLYRAHRGLRIAQLTITGKGGVTFAGDELHPAVHDLPAVISGLQAFGDARNRHLKIPEAYAANPSPASWMITKVQANEWRPDARLAVPELARVELFWETMPGETQAEVEAEFEAWLDELRTNTGIDVTHRYFLRWMEGYQLPAEHPFAECATKHASEALGEQQSAIGAPFPCDLFLFDRLGVPAGLIFGPAGNNAHTADEWVDLDSVFDVVRIYARIVCDWCMTPRDA